MIRLPFKYQIALGPIVIAFTLACLIWYTLTQFSQIQIQGEAIRQWTRTTDRLHIAISTGQRLIDIAKAIQSTPADQDELYFTYLEQSRIFSDNVLSPDCVERMPGKLRQVINTTEAQVRFREGMDPKAVIAHLSPLLPQLEQQYNSWWAQKRGAYIDYYNNVQSINNRLHKVSLFFLAACLLLATGFTLWTFRTTNRRLQNLVNETQAICHGELTSISAPAHIIDEIDKVRDCVANMTHRLVKVVAVEKVLQGVEAERRRIAMDMHDQVLADLTVVTRKIDSLLQDTGIAANEKLSTEVSQLKDELALSAQTIRDVIDDLHPHTLEILGLGPTLEALCARVCKGAHCPKYYCSIDEHVDAELDDFSRITLYRIINELLVNIIRHAQCSQYELLLRRENRLITLTVEDNGIGFDRGHIKPGHGLVNIEERARSINADIHWSHSRFSSGSCFQLKLRTST